MDRTTQLYEYLKGKATNMTENWLDQRERDGSTYDINASEEVISDLKTQNQEFINIICKSLLGETDYTHWASEVGAKRAKSHTELSDMLKNFKKFRLIFMNFVLEFAKENEATPSDIGDWVNKVNYTFDHIIELTSIQYQKVHKEYMEVQREMVLELSSPVIPVYPGVGILPLVGSIDTHRAKVIREKAMEQASKLNLHHLIIDLSGVPIVDTMVANELFQVFQALSLLGIKSSLTGISPAIAQTSVQLGLDFKRIPTYADLNQALMKTVENR